MDAIQKELDKLHKRLPGLLEPASTRKSSAKDANSNAILALDRLIGQMEAAQERLIPYQQDASSAAGSSAQGPPLSGAELGVLLAELRAEVDQTQRIVGERQKEFYGALSKFGKALEKKFPLSASSIADPTLFSSLPAQRALEGVVLEHFLREGEWDLAQSFAEESGLKLPQRAASNFEVLHSTISAIERGDLDPAIAWAEAEREFLKERGSAFEYALHRSRFLQIALGADTRELPGMEASAAGSASLLDVNDDPDGERLSDAHRHTDDMMEESLHDLRSAPTCSGAAEPASDWTHTNVDRALFYSRKYFNPFTAQHLPEIQKLLTFLLFIPVLPISVTPISAISVAAAEEPSAIAPEDLIDFVPAPYRVFLDAHKMHAPFLVPLFKAEFCVRQGIARDAPLRIAVDLGAGGALNKILKVRTVMKESGTDWSQADELPIEIPLPTQLRFHSIFCCPVSKEQGTDENPPMMMECGHVVCKDSLLRLSKGAGDYRKVKCPYCPIESTVGRAQRLYF